jgi:hypothetical protein
MKSIIFKLPYLKPTQAHLLNTLSHPHYKTLKLLKKCFVKTLLKNPTYFGHCCMTILRGLPLYLVHYHFSACLLWHLPIRYVAVCRLCVCLPGVPVCGLSGFHDQTTHRQVHRAHMHIDGIQPHTE